MAGTEIAQDGKHRCKWACASSEFIEYHDTEWGVPVIDDVRLFEKICLEAFQSGLSWRTILAKRENFRRAFCDFDFHKIAQFTRDDVTRLMQDSSIVRNRLKIESVIINAQRAVEMVSQEKSLAAYFWSFEPDKTQLDPPQSVSVSDASRALAKDLKKRGWKFVGPTTAFAFMQAMGVVNDHAENCFMREIIEAKKSRLVRPEN